MTGEDVIDDDGVHRGPLEGPLTRGSIKGSNKITGFRGGIQPDEPVLSVS